MKILHVIAGYTEGGAETFAFDAFRALKAKGLEQHVICRPHDKFLKALHRFDIPYDVMDFTLIDRLWRGKRLIRQRAHSFQPDLVQSWMGRASSIMPLDLEIPCIGWFGGPYDLKRYRASDFYIGVTKELAQYIAQESQCPDRTFLIHTFGTLEADEPVSRADFETPDDAPVVLLLSRMHQKKGVDTLLEAATGLEGVYFWLAGDGPDLEKYQKMATALDLDDRVRFLGWRTDRSALLDAADVCVLPSRYEPFGTVMAEAWYAKTPVVAAKADGPRQYVTHDKDGLLCEIDDVADLRRQLHRAIHDKALAAHLVENGSALYHATFSEEVVANEYVAAYKKMITMGKK